MCRKSLIVEADSEERAERHQESLFTPRQHCIRKSNYFAVLESTEGKNSQEKISALNCSGHEQSAQWMLSVTEPGFMLVDVMQSAFSG